MKWPEGTSLELKVGVFAVLTLAIIIYATMRVSDRTLFKGGDYTVAVVLESAEGLTQKTPVEVAGIQVGYIEDLDLHEGKKAKVKIRLNRAVKLGKDASAQVRTKGFLGETYIDLQPGNSSLGVIAEEGEITATNPFVDLGQIAGDLKEITSSLRRIISDDESAPLKKVLDNIETFTGRMSEMTVQNQENVNQIIANLNHFSSDLSDVMADRKEGLRDTMERLNSITKKVEEGRGSLGRLINDEETAENINSAARGLSETVGGVNRFQIGFDYHLEYLGVTRDFKNYTGFILQPRPDKYFRLDFIVDPNPSPTEKVTTSTAVTGGVSTTTTTSESVVDKNQFLISAQLAKTFYNFTLRGGLIESRGGMGLDYNQGPFGVQFTAFDFRNEGNQRPHLKVLGNINLTKNFFLVSGVDDILSKQQDPDWFVGGGLRFIDNDIRSLMGAANLR